MATKEVRARRVDRKLFNSGNATDQDERYICLKCGEVFETTVNHDGLIHGLPLPACGGLIVIAEKEHEGRAKKNALELLRLLKFMTRQCESLYNGNGFTHDTKVIGKWIEDAKAVLSDSGRKASLEGERDARP